MRILPDGLTGAIMAVEGISDAMVLLHGPGGCRVRHTVLSSAVIPRREPGCDVPYFYGAPRVPATFLDEYDYINGAAYKLDESLPLVSGRGPALVALVDSPGAGLIGDDRAGALERAGMAGEAVLIGGGLSSAPATEAVGRTLETIMEHLDPVRGTPVTGSVNLLGLSLLDKDWEAAREDLEELLNLMGLDVICVPGAGSSVDDLIRSVDAELNVVVCPEQCRGLLEWYSSRGVPYVASPDGAPVGFDAMESWVRAVADAAGRDPSQALKRINDTRMRITRKFEGLRYSSSRIKGRTFSVAGPSSVALPLTRWLHRYLCMVPRAVAVDPGSDRGCEDRLWRYLEEAGFPEARGREPVPCDFVLCEGVTAVTMSLDGGCRAGIPIGSSTMGLDDVIPRPVYGIRGCMYILDEVLHGVRGA